MLCQTSLWCLFSDTINLLNWNQYYQIEFMLRDLNNNQEIRSLCALNVQYYKINLLFAVWLLLKNSSVYFFAYKIILCTLRCVSFYCHIFSASMINNLIKPYYELLDAFIFLQTSIFSILLGMSTKNNKITFFCGRKLELRLICTR